uniref:Uncharacterized protein n=1 Tax=Romanomermis culicivorax TaxID=13658 RepID=A0A915IC65_ROMCU
MRLNPWGDFERIPWVPVTSGLNGDNNHIFLNQQRIDQGRTNYLDYRRILYRNQNPDTPVASIFPTEAPNDPLAFRERLRNEQLGNFEDNH